MNNYILQVILFQVLFLAVYDFFLSKETFFTKNRWYLLCTPVLSFVLPLIKIPTFQKVVPQEYVIQLPEIVLKPDKVIQQTIQETNIEQSINYINILFWLGVGLFSVLFLIKLMKIITFIKENETIEQSDFILILIPNQTKAFSFFKYIFLGKEVPKYQQEKVIQHELVHSQQKHSLDLLFFEVLKIVMWFNPMIYFYQKRITLVHEYISDAVVAKSETKESYINNLLSSFFQVENIEFVNQFYKKSFIKKRVIMMKKNQSKTVNQLKYLVLVPILISMLFYSSCSETSSDELTSSKLQLQTRYTNVEGKLVAKQLSKEAYLDSYIGVEAPIGAIEISFDKLSKEEQEEFDMEHLKFRQRINEKPELEKMVSFKYYKMPNGRKASALLFNIDKLKAREEARIKDKIASSSIIEKEEVSFMLIDQAPTFPGCEEGDKDCFSSSIQKHFVKHFDADLPNSLGLSKGRKRIFIAFNIDKEGNVVDVKARAPHKAIKEEVLAVMNSLPKVTPGEMNGENVIVKYSIPFTIIVE